MTFIKISVLSFLVGLVATIDSQSYYDRDDRILEKDIQVLDLRADEYAIRRRNFPSLQLQRVGGDAPEELNPKEVRCYRIAIIGDKQWDCVASNLDTKIEFGHLEVSCEGYDFKNDSYVTYGSCSLAYELNFKKKELQLWILLIIGIVVLMSISMIIACCCVKRKKSRKNFGSSANISISGEYEADTSDNEGDDAKSITDKRMKKLKKLREKYGEIKIVINL